MIAAGKTELFIAALPFVAVMAAFMGAAVSGGAEKEKNTAGAFFCGTGLVIVFLSLVFMLLYMAGNSGVIAGISVKKQYLAPAVLMAGLGLFFFGLYGKSKKSGFDTLFFAASAVAAGISGNLMVLFLAFILADMPAGMRAKKTAEFKWKYFYFLAGMVFAVIAVFNNEITAAKTEAFAITGIIFFMGAAVSLTPLGSGEGPAEGEREARLLCFPLQLIILFRVILENRFYISPVPAAAAFAVFMMAGMWSALRDEKVSDFMVRDMTAAGIFICVVFLSSVAEDGAAAGAALFGAAALSAAVFNAEKGAEKTTVSKIKYRPGGVKNIHAALMYLLFIAGAEVYAFIILYFRVKSSPAIKAVAAAACVVYLIGMLNKVFMAFAVISRLRIDHLRKMLLNKGAARAALFLVFTAAVFLA